MKQGLEKMGALISAQNQYFLCFEAGIENRSEASENKIKILHEASSGIDPEKFKKILHPDVPADLLELYSRYGSIRLFCDQQQTASVFYLAHPEEWSELRSELDAWLNELSGQEKADLIPSWIDQAFVIGEIPNAGSFFIYSTQGDNAGCIFEFFHDGYEFNLVAKNLSDFIEGIAELNEAWIKRIASSIRYIDTSSGQQWVPERFYSSNSVAR